MKNNNRHKREINESPIHSQGKSMLYDRLCSLKRRNMNVTICRQCVTCQVAHVFEHSLSNVDIHVEYPIEWHGHRRADIACVSPHETVIFEIKHTSRTNDIARPEPWYEFDAGSIVNTGGPLDLVCVRKWSCCTRLGQVYVNQCGAGSGKTYKAVQLLQENRMFDEKTTYIYVTKMHSAKDVIYGEIEDQRRQGMLNNLRMVSENKARQYHLEFTHVHTGLNICCLIGTVDSFICAAQNGGTSKDPDIFKAYAKNIAAGNIKDIKQYAQAQRSLNNELVLILDEAQDLETHYYEALRRLTTESNMDVYIIGDRLQSIFQDKNILSEPLDYISIKSPNICRRFQNTVFKDFVNTAIRFEKFGLEPITSCADNAQPGKLPDVFVINRDTIIKDVLERVEREVTDNNYLPMDFLFVFPVVSGNVLMYELENALQEWWTLKMHDGGYRAIVEADPRMPQEPIKNWNRYVMTHKSNPGIAINLQDSKYMTRMVSIHASKGDGRNVVFVLDLSDKALQCFRCVDGDLRYESLLHVAITRMKRSLYLGIRYAFDAVGSRFLKVTSDKMEELRHNGAVTLDGTLDIHDCVPGLEDISFASDLGAARGIEYGHHTIRYCMATYEFMRLALNYRWKKQQFYAKLMNVACAKIRIYTTYNDYKKRIQFSHVCKSCKCLQLYAPACYKCDGTLILDAIPILRMVSNNGPFCTYARYMEEMIVALQRKLRIGLNAGKIPELCTMEMILLMYCIEINDGGGWRGRITILDVFDIMAEFGGMCSGGECLCNKLMGRVASSDVRDFYNDVLPVREHVQTVINMYPDAKWVTKRKHSYDLGGVSVSTQSWFSCKYNKRTICVQYAMEISELTQNTIAYDALMGAWVCNGLTTHVITVGTGETRTYVLERKDVDREIVYKVIRETLFPYITTLNKWHEMNHKYADDKFAANVHACRIPGFMKEVLIDASIDDEPIEKLYKDAVNKIIRRHSCMLSRAGLAHVDPA